MNPDRDQLLIHPRALAAFAKARRPGFETAVRAAAQSTPEGLRIARARYHEISTEYFQRPAALPTPTPQPPPDEPTVAELAANFTGALGRWLSAGAPVVSAEIYATRAAACDACPHWSATARLGLGKCSAPGCGCTSLKRWLATERCPLAHWPAAL